MKPTLKIRDVRNQLTDIQGLLIECEMALEAWLDPPPGWTQGDNQEARKRAKNTLAKLRGETNA